MMLPKGGPEGHPAADFPPRRRRFPGNVRCARVRGGRQPLLLAGGFYEAVADRLGLPPKLSVGVSAGAFACIYSALAIGPRVRELVLAACGPQRKNFDFAAWCAGGPLCPVGPMYRALLERSEEHT